MMRHSEFLRKQIIGILNFANQNSDFGFPDIGILNFNPIRISGIKNEIRILLSMGVPEIVTENQNSQPRTREENKSKSKMVQAILPLNPPNNVKE